MKDGISSLLGCLLPLTNFKLMSWVSVSTEALHNLMDYLIYLNVKWKEIFNVEDVEQN